MRELIPLEGHDLNGSKSSINRHLLTVGSNLDFNLLLYIYFLYFHAP